MRFEITQQFDASPEGVQALYLDESFIAGGADEPDSRIAYVETVHHEVHDQSALLEVRYRFTADLPAAATAIISPDRLTWVERTEVDIESLVSTITIVPDHYANRLSASATATIWDPEGDGGAGAVRSITGELKVRALLVGGQVERVIVDGMREHFAAEEARAADALG